MADKLDDFRQREGREPSRWERAALTREASADTRSGKSGNGAVDLATRWRTEAADAGWTVELLDASIDEAAADRAAAEPLLVADVVGGVSDQRSSWTRADVLQAICDVQRPVSQQSGHRWAATLERATDHVLAQLVDLDPPGDTTRRGSDGRSVWIEPTAPRYTSEAVLAQEEAILTWAMAAQADPATPSRHGRTATGLDPLQADAAAAVAGDDRLVLVVGPAGAGKTRMLTTAGHDLQANGRVVFAVAPTAKAARTVERDTGIRADTVAKLLHEHQRTDRPPLPEYQLPAGATLIVDEAGMLSTPALHQVVTLAGRNGWRLALVGDPRQLQGVGRGGLFAELCANGRVDELERLHRFTHAWEAAASLQLRRGDPAALDAYEAHGRIVAGTLDDHLARIAATWIDHHDTGRSLAIVASTNDHVDTINHAIQTARLDAGAPRRHDVRHGSPPARPPTSVTSWRPVATTADSSPATVSRSATATPGPSPPSHRDGSITVSHQGRTRRRDAAGRLRAGARPARLRRDRARLAVRHRRHRHRPHLTGHHPPRPLRRRHPRPRHQHALCVVTDSDDVAEARDVLEAVLAVDRADVPATTQRRTLAQTVPRPASSPIRRCEVPEWFPTVLADAQRDLLAAEEQRGPSPQRDEPRRPPPSPQRMRRWPTSQQPPPTTATPCAPPKLEPSMLDASTPAPNVASPQRRVVSDAPPATTSSWPSGNSNGPRTTWQALANEPAPAVERHSRAVADQRDAHEELRTCDTVDRLDAMTPSVGEHRMRVRALTTWKQWADGHPVPDRSLRTVAAILNQRAGLQRQLAAALPDERSPATPPSRPPRPI